MQHTDTHAGNRWLPSRLVLPTSKSKRMGTMVNRNAFVSEPAEFVSVIAAKDLPENKPIRVNAQGTPVLLVRRGKKNYALGAVCSHFGAPMEEGHLKNGTVECD